jgi:hypothetical protein
MQPTVVEDSQLKVLQCETATMPVAVKSSPPKLKPVTVSERPIELARLDELRYDATGASCVNLYTAVPATAPLVTVITGILSCAIDDRQLTDVCDVHRAVEHEASSTNDEVVKSTVPKLSPETVMDASPVIGVLCTENDTAGASNEYCIMLVPAVAPTVICVPTKSEVILP